MTLLPTLGEHAAAEMLVLAGDLDPEAARAMKRGVMRLEAGGAHLVTLDLSGVETIDCVAVGALLDTDARLSAAGARLEVVLPHGPARAVLELLGTGGRLTFTDAGNP